ncbi:MAG: type II toxin-antitoxin system RelB/DinJ family antitoxin [Oscillospiraceae bacterium]|nr:type II toxin-antitoxin system RelB/DinJ family antitoxin [Oscillospiraceae bacterium]
MTNMYVTILTMYVDEEVFRMANHTTIRLEAEKKEEFAKLCENMGLTVSGAINLFVTKVLQCRRIPFDVTADGDPFYSNLNQSILLRSIEELNRGEGKTYDDVSEVFANRS